MSKKYSFIKYSVQRQAYEQQKQYQQLTEKLFYGVKLMRLKSLPPQARQSATTLAWL